MSVVLVVFVVSVDSCSVVLDDVLGPSGPHIKVSLILCRFGSNTYGESRALEGRLVSSNSLSRVGDGDEGVGGRKVRE